MYTQVLCVCLYLFILLSTEDDDEEEEINNRIIKKIEDYYPENKFTVRYMF